MREAERCWPYSSWIEQLAAMLRDAVFELKTAAGRSGPSQVSFFLYIRSEADTDILD